MWKETNGKNNDQEFSKKKYISMFFLTSGTSLFKRNIYEKFTLF